MYISKEFVPYLKTLFLVNKTQGNNKCGNVFNIYCRFGRSLTVPVYDSENTLLRALHRMTQLRYQVSGEGEVVMEFVSGFVSSQSINILFASIFQPTHTAATKTVARQSWQSTH